MSYPSLLQQSSLNPVSFRDATDSRDNAIWGTMALVSVGQAIDEWLTTLRASTQRNYRCGVNILAESGLLNIWLSLQAFSQLNHDAVIDQIKLLPMAETTRQARAALYIAFTRYLSRRFPQVFKKAMPCREGTGKTFYRVHEKVVTEAMNQRQWMGFLEALEKINPRDCLIAKICLQGGKRINEVLTLTTDLIDWEECEITFKQSKTRGVNRETVITYPKRIMDAIRDHIGKRIGYVFLSAKGNPVCLNQVSNTFSKAGILAGVPFKVTPHVLRASAVTYLKQQGFSDSDVMKISGHASSEMVNAYDKSSRADNASKRVSLV